jgi:phospholipid/cholesterol/gamma-HCH transport system permease protein
MVGINESIVFGFLVLQFLLFRGFNTKGGALEMGQATAAVTNSLSRCFCAGYLLAELLT